MKIIITGATGPIGIPLIHYCISENIEVLAIIKNGSNRAKDIPKNDKVKIIDCGIEKIHEIEDIENEYEALIHLAWTHTKGDDRKKPVLQAQNISLTLSVAEFAKKVGCKVFIGAGSQAEYGVLNFKASELTPANPIEAYGMAKLASGQLALNYCHDNDMRACWVRIFSTYGPYENDYTFLSYLVRTLMNGREPKLTPGEQIWDYIYCEDAARALIELAIKPSADGLYCLGGGNARSIKEYVNCVASIICPERKLFFGNIPYGNNQSMHLEADITKLCNDTGFSPQVPFEEGMRRTIQWYEENSSRFF